MRFKIIETQYQSGYIEKELPSIYAAQKFAKNIGWPKFKIEEIEQLFARCVDCKIEYQRSERDLNRYEHQCPECRKRYYRKYCKEWRKKTKEKGKINHIWAANPQNKSKLKVQQKTNRLYKKNMIVSKPCIICHNPKAQKHHPDYSRPTLIVWLCAKCHWMIHHNLEYFIQRKEKGEKDGKGKRKKLCAAIL